MDDSAYRYAGVPLTPAIAAALLTELFAGKIAETRAIQDAVVAAHLKRGGTPAKSDIPRVIKKALSELRADGTAVNVSLGHWQIGTKTLPAEKIDTEAGEAPIVDPVPSDVVELGEGPEAVYVYYLPTYRKLAEQESRNIWPCKIGRTSGDPLTRIAAQAATALPEPPHMAVLIWTKSSLDWERAVHGVLAARGRRVQQALGVEWFDTSPSEVIEIVTWIDPAISP